MSASVRKASAARLALAGLGLGAMSLVAACAPPPSGGGGGSTTTTTTTNVTYACSGAGIIGPGGAQPVGPIADQVTTVAITLPNSASVGVPFDVTVNVGNLALAAAPGFLDLNAAGVVATIETTGTNANPSVAADNFVGNGASIDLKPATTTATAGSAGTKTVTVGDLDILAGGTGFACSPVGTPASASVEAA